MFSESLGPNAIPFDFNSDWVKLYLGKVGGEHVLGYKFVSYPSSFRQLSLNYP